MSEIKTMSDPRISRVNFTNPQTYLDSSNQKQEDRDGSCNLPCKRRVKGEER